jgi:hypothetical protein
MICYNYRVICLGAFFSVISCHIKEKPSPDNYGNVPLIITKDNEGITHQVETVEGNTEYYAYIIPKEHGDKLPLFVLIDPHGNGKLAIDKFKPALKDYQIAVIGLNNVRNNTPNYDILIKQAVTSASQELPVNGAHIYYCGFSGGARMAFQYALTNNCEGVIMCGAGPQKNMLEKINFPLVAVSGFKDFNFIEQFYSPDNFLALKPGYISFYFNGKHEWPPSDIVKESISFLLLKSGLRENIAETDIKSILNKKDSLLLLREYLPAFKVLEKAYKTCDDNNKEIFLVELREMNSSQSIKTFFLSFENILKGEIARNQDYYRCLYTKNINWWLNEITEIDDRSGRSGDSLIAYSYSRSRAFLGVLLYSVTNSVIHNKEYSDLTDKLLMIYENLEPENPDVYYFKALYALQENDTRSCLNYLKKSKKLGFNDFSLLKKDFPVSVYKKVFKTVNAE